MKAIHPFAIRRSLLALTSVAVLAGCAVGPNYVRPDVSLEPYHNAEAVAARQASAPPMLDQWWNGFSDPVLASVIQRALDQNLDLVAAVARVEQARAMAASAGAQLFPQAELGASAMAAHQSMRGVIGSIAGGMPGFSRDVRQYTIGPAASWEIDIAGGLRRGAAAARDEAQAAEATQAGTRVMVAADAADAYFHIRGFQARIATAEQQIQTAEHLLRLVQDRYKAGASQGREVAQAEAVLKQTRAVLPSLRMGLEAQSNRLDVLMGAQPGTYAKNLGVVDEIPSIPAIPADEHPTELLRRRPDVIAAERRLAASNERIGAALAGYYPKISLSGALGFDSLSGHLLSSSAFQAVGGGALRWRLFDFGRVDAEVKQARGANAEALAVYRQSVLRAAEDVENAFMALVETETLVGELRQQVMALTKARELSQDAYQAGSIPLTDVLDADRQLLRARDELQAGQANSARAAVAVFRALGGGWEASPPAVAING